MTVNPIPASQIVNVNLEWDCLSQPTCTTLELSLQEILNAVCLLKQPTLQDGTCISGVTLYDILSDIGERVCTLEETVGISDTSSSSDSDNSDAFDINYCIKDFWTTADDCCIDLGCSNEDVTKDAQIQSLYSRVLSYCDIIKEQATKIEELETKFNTLQLEVDNINTNCC